MKLFRVWLLLWGLGVICALPGTTHAQGTQKLVRRNAKGQLIYGTATRNTTTYPRTSTGAKAFGKAVTTGVVPVTLTVASSTSTTSPVPVTTTAPGSVTNATPPSWLSARYTYATGSALLDVEAAPVNSSDAIQLMFERQDGASLSGSNPDNVPLVSGSFFGSGPLSGQGSYTQHWAFGQKNGNGGIPKVPLKLTFKRGSDTYAYFFTPSDATRAQLFTATNSSPPSSTTTSSPTITQRTYPAFTRGVIIGNSITTHTASTALNWTKNNGMAASAPANDFAHLVLAELQKTNPNLTLAAMGQGSGLELGYNSSDPDAVTNTLSNLNYDLAQLNGANAPYDLIILRIGENAGSNFDGAKFRAMLDQTFAAINKASSCTILLTDSFWNGSDGANAVLKSYASEKGYKFASFASFRERADLLATDTDANGNFIYSDAGVRRHPKDNGHVLIADAILAQLATGSTTAPAPTTVASTYAFASPNTDYQPVADQGWNPVTTREKFIQNGQIKVGFLWAGAVISYAGKLTDNQNLVNSYQVVYDDDPNDFRYNKTVDDLGRQIMFGSDYCTPAPGPNRGLEFLTKNADGSLKSTRTGYSPTSGRYVWPGNPWTFNTGANPVQGGSLFPAMTPSLVLASAVYTHPTRGQEFYAKIRAAVWGVKGEPGWIVLEEWVSLKGNAIVAYVRHTVEERDPARMSEQRGFYANEQENPCIYGIAPFAEKIITTASGRTDIRPTGGAVFSATYLTPDCKIGMYGNGTGLTYYSPMNSAVKAGQFGDFNGDWTSASSSYINAAVRFNYDNAGIYDDYCYIVVGNESEANSTISTLPGIDQGFSFDFSKENMRWWNVDSRLKRETGNQWTWYLDSKTDNNVTSYQCKLQSPFRAWQASGISSVSFEMAVSGATQLDMIWSKPGVDNGPEYTKRFAVTPDGQFRTYTVSTADGNWTGIISSIGLKAVDGSTSPGAKVIVRTIQKQ